MKEHTPMITRRTLLALCATGALTFAAAACGDDDGGSSTGGVTVENAWARQSPAATTRGAIYLDITSDKADALVTATVPASVAATVEIHETVTGDMTETTMAGGMTETTMAGGMTGTTMAGSDMMSMRPIEKLDLPAGKKVSLKPGGYHIMLIDLAAPLTVGQQIDLTLAFESGASLTFKVEVREDAP